MKKQTKIHPFQTATGAMINLQNLFNVSQSTYNLWRGNPGPAYEFKLADEKPKKLKPRPQIWK